MNSQSMSLVFLFVKTGPFARMILFLTTIFSVMALAVIIQKVKMYRRERARNMAFLYLFNNADTLQDIAIRQDAAQCGILENICRTGILEFNRLLESVLSHPRDTMSGIFIESQFSIVKDHIDKTVSEEVSKLDRHLVLLAITGSTCPLLGLLGTVWGITRAFADIGSMGQASLNVVAPGIAEALITTIWGIAVAIPGVIGYNVFASRNKNLEDDAYNFSALLTNKIKIHFFDLIYKKNQDKQK
jgi:biopolymer transport protein TolQ